MKPLKGAGGAAVELCSIRKRYGDNVVLRDIDIDVPAGSFTTFLGPSGSGKTTTLAITTGLVAPDGGTVRIGGEDCTTAPVHKRNLGFVFQSYALFPHMTIEKNIAFPLSLRHTDKAEMRRRVGEALELVRLTGFERRYPSQLSGGQQQRVALARAVVFQPRVLLMDEPLGALDAGLRAHLQREIVRIGRQLGVTILYVTHDQDEALSMSDQIVLFHNGNIDQAGAPRDIYTSPHTAFAASFLGAGSLVDGCLETGVHGPLIRTASGLTVPVDPVSVAARHLVVGQTAAAVLRPECVSLQSTDTASSIGEGTVDDIIYTGSRVRISINLGGGHRAEYHCDANLAGDRRLGDRSSVFVSTTHLPAAVPFDVGDAAATQIDPDPEADSDTDTAPDNSLAMAGER